MRPLVRTSAFLLIHTILSSHAAFGLEQIVAFGNLGAAGTGSLGTLQMDIGSGNQNNANWAAQGFNTGTASSVNLEVVSVTLGIFGTTTVGQTVPITVSIYSATGSPAEPDTTAPLYSSTAEVGNTGRYVFPFTNAYLQSNTTYFVMPTSGTWYYNAGVLPGTPAQQNSSGYTYVSTLQSFWTGTSPQGPWSTSDSPRFSISITVPEPSSLLLAGLAVGISALSMRKSRRRC